MRNFGKKAIAQIPFFNSIHDILGVPKKAVQEKVPSPKRAEIHIPIWHEESESESESSRHSLEDTRPSNISHHSEKHQSEQSPRSESKSQQKSE